MAAVATAARRAVLVVEQHEADSEGAEGEGRKACPQRQVYDRQIQSYPRITQGVASVKVHKGADVGSAGCNRQMHA